MVVKIHAVNLPLICDAAKLTYTMLDRTLLHVSLTTVLFSLTFSRHPLCGLVCGPHCPTPKAGCTPLTLFLDVDRGPWTLSLCVTLFFKTRAGGRL